MAREPRKPFLASRPAPGARRRGCPLTLPRCIRRRADPRPRL